MPRQGNRNAKVGNYYKGRTKKWYEENGWVVAHMERMMWIHGTDKETGAPNKFPVKRDQLGCDLMARNEHAIHFVQVKFGRKNLAGGRRELLADPCPSCDCVKRVIVVWEKGARQPELIFVKPEETTPSGTPVVVEEPPRRGSKVSQTTLF